MGLNEYKKARQDLRCYESAVHLAIYEGLVAMGTHLLDENGRTFSVDKLKNEKIRREAADKFTIIVGKKAAKYFSSKLPAKDEEGKEIIDSKFRQLAYLFSAVSHEQVLGPLNEKQDKFKLGELGTDLVARNGLLQHYLGDQGYGGSLKQHLSVSDAGKIVKAIGAEDKVDASRVNTNDLAYLVDKWLDNGFVTPEDVKNKAWAKSGEAN